MKKKVNKNIKEAVEKVKMGEKQLKLLKEIANKVDKVQDKVEKVERDVDRADDGVIYIDRKMNVILLGFLFIVVVGFIALVCSSYEPHDDTPLLNQYCDELNYTGYIEDEDIYDGTVVGSRHRLGYCYNDAHEPYYKVWKHEFKLWKKIKGEIKE